MFASLKWPLTMDEPEFLTDADNVESRNLPTHVALCRLRNQDVSKRLGRIEYILYAVGGTIAAAMLKVLAMSPGALSKIVSAF